MNENNKNIKRTNTMSTIFEDIFIKDYTYFDIYSKKEIWQELEKILNGKFKIIRSKSGDISTFRLDFTYKTIIVNLIETSTQPLKFDFNTNLTEHLEFNISLEDNLDKLMKFFGKKEFEIQQSNFDNKYYIQTNNFSQLKMLLEKKELSDLIIQNDIYGINSIIDKKTQLTNILTVANRNIDTLDKLVKLVKLQLLFIDRLYEINLIRKLQTVPNK